MSMLPEDNPYEVYLIDLLRAINREVPMDEEDRMLVLLELNSETKIMQFRDWVESRMDGDNLKATAPEITRAATRICKGEQPQ